MLEVKHIICFILILIIFLQFYLIIIYNIFKTNHYDCKFHKIYKKILLSDAYPYFKTGDLLFFSFNDVDLKSRSFINSRFSHMAMIYENNTNLYTIEINFKDTIKPKDNKTYSHMNILPLYDRIKYYSGSIYYSSLINELSLDKKNKLENCLNNKHKYKYSNMSLLLYQFLLHSNKFYKHNRFCSELIAELLHTLDISSTPFKSTKFNLSNNIINLTNNTIYTNPINILVDNLMITNMKDSNYITYC